MGNPSSSLSNYINLIIFRNPLTINTLHIPVPYTIIISYSDKKSQRSMSQFWLYRYTHTQGLLSLVTCYYSDSGKKWLGGRGSLSGWLSDRVDESHLTPRSTLGPYNHSTPTLSVSMVSPELPPEVVVPTLPDTLGYHKLKVDEESFETFHHTSVSLLGTCSEWEGVGRSLGHYTRWQ